MKRDRDGRGETGIGERQKMHRGAKRKTGEESLRTSDETKPRTSMRKNYWEKR
jgi:hypothetical protein